MRKRFSISLFGVIYIAVGIIIAVSRGYITLGFVKTVLSDALAVALWWLVLLGINLHVH